MSAQNGEIWINNSLDQLRFKVNNLNRTLVSNSWYAVGTANIPLGTPLSLNTSGQVVPLDTSVSTKCIGVANTAVSGGTVGTTQIEVTNSGKLTISQALMSTTSPNLDALDSGSDIGKVLYVSRDAGKYTLSREGAVLEGRQLVEIGTLVSYVSTSTFTLEIGVQGDSRGPLGFSQVEYPIAEEVFVTNANGSITPRAFSLGSAITANTFSQTLWLKIPSDDTVVTGSSNGNYAALHQQYIILYNGLRAIGYYFNTTAGSGLGVPAALAIELNSLAPVAFQETYEVYQPSSTKVFVTRGALVTGNYYNFSGTTSFLNNLINVMFTAAKNQNLVGATSTTSAFVTNPAPTSGAIGTVYLDAAGYRAGLTIESIPGYERGIYVKFSGSNGDLNGFVDTSLTILNRQGNKISKTGTVSSAILADNRYLDASNVIGFLISDPLNVEITAGSTGVFQKIGTMSGFTGLTPGAPLFLGQNGEVTQSSTSLGGLNTVQLGLAKNNTTIDININSVTDSPELDYPVGAVLKLPSGVSTADYGFTLCNGSTVIDSSSFTNSYTEFVNYVNKVNGTSASTVTVPNLSGYQIKTLRLGGKPKYPSAFSYGDVKTYTQVNALSTVGGVKTWNFDYTTSLGSLTDFSSANLTKIVLKYFLKKASDSSYTEVQPGIQSFGGTTFGFTTTDGFIDSPRKYAANINFYLNAGSAQFGYVDGSGVLYLAAGSDQLIIQAYRAENFEFFIGPELTYTRANAHNHANKTYLDSIDQLLFSYSTVSFDKLRSTNSLDSSSTSTGSLVVSGGLGLAKNLYLGGVVNQVSTYSGTNAITIQADALASAAAINISTSASSINSAASSYGVYINRTGTYVTGLQQAFGIYSSVTATNAGTNTALRLIASGGATNYSLLANGAVSITGDDAATPFTVTRSKTTATSANRGNILSTFTQTVADSAINYAVQATVANTHTSGAVASSIGVLAGVTSSGAAGTTTAAAAFRSAMTAGTSATITNLSHFYAAASSISGTVTNEYGLYVDTLAGTTNYSIYTGTSPTYLGGMLTAAGGLTVGALGSGKTVTLASSFTTTGAFALTFTTTAATVATLPSGTITLVDLTATQTLSNKSITGYFNASSGITIPSSAGSGNLWVV